jgi:3-hydroxybutyrate dehydrogenase
VNGEHRAALVTGAASGIGAAIAARLRRDEWDVLAVDVRGDVDFHADLTTRAGNREAVTAAAERFGRLDAVIPNAGFQHVAPIEAFPEDRWDAMIALLLTSPFLLARYAWPHLRASGSGRFVAIASVHGLVASPFKAAYVSAKHGVLGLVKTLALEGAEHGISASALCPSYVRTPLVEGQIADQAQAHGVSEARVLEEVLLAPQAVKRLIEPDEVAATVAFLLGPDGRAFTGAPVIMDQGWSAR